MGDVSGSLVRPTLQKSEAKWVRDELGTLTAVPIRSGTYVPKNQRGRGSKLVNMGELFANPRLFDIEMERVPISNEDGMRFGLQTGDLLFARRSMIGTGASQCSIVRELEHGSVFDSSLIRVRVDTSRLDPQFLFYFFWSPKGRAEIDSIGRHGPISGITGKDLATLQVPVPVLEEQRAIARVLGSLDDKIELNRRMNQTLEEICRALFKFWFVDFGPVRAKAEGRWKKGESLPGMPADMWELWPSEFEESEIGEIPWAWKVLRAGEAVGVSGGSTPSTSDPSYWDGGTFAWATPKDLAALRTPVLLHTERSITETGLGTISSGLLPKGTVLLSSRAPIGYLAIAEIPVAVNQGFIAIQCNGTISNQYVLRWAEANVEEIKAVANGTTFLEINKQNFRLLPMLVPNEATLSRFTELASALYRMEVSNEAESATLASARDALLPKLLSGEIRVPVDGGG